MNDIILKRDYKESRWSIFSWAPTSLVNGYKAEKKLLETEIQFDDKTSVGYVELDKNKRINTLTLTAHPSNQKNLVMTHGYGAGLGFYYKNYNELKKMDGFNVYAIDWLGMANSSRPSFVKSHYRDTEDKVVSDAEDFFVDSLEEWRKKMGLDQMVLLGHSLDLSTCYALKYPSRVEKLILVSPVGVPVEPPPAEQQIRPGFLMRFFRTLWSWNITPMSVIRTLGPAGPSLVRKYTSRRFAHLADEENKALEDYIYHISAQSGSGEYALARLLKPGAWAKKPLYHRVHDLKMPTSFIYGDQDWMDHRHALNTVGNFKSPVKVAVVANAGHHLYLGNYC
ncbi:hypothetical protein HK103_005635 [Boothiomyces macroporosus]|uniref:AB hydrolase-1 domain-containing protein n=1 Tax=Boothiomyces macroporosus TaxID=261099 RepID=A0AAD5UEV0_9FUNG|nr:hypothetical protein HK103_005635 [Boothiomyces macroporosus]